MKHAVAFLALFLAARAASGQSELRFASHLEIHGANADATGAATAVSATDVVTVVSERGTRTESHQTVPAGFNSTVIQRSDGTIILDEGVKAYFKTPPFAANPAPIPQIDVSYTRTGEFTTIAGIRAERVSFTIKTVIPTPAGGQATIETTGDVWPTDQFSTYKIIGVGAGRCVGAAIHGAGFPLRTIIRGGMVGPNELDVTVTSVAEEPFQPELFDPPPDYKERSIPGN